jgi:RNA polymerase primary sigma factor
MRPAEGLPDEIQEIPDAGASRLFDTSGSEARRPRHEGPMSSVIRRSPIPASTDSLTTYLQEIRAYPLLARSEEVALAERIQNGDTAALDRLVCANLRFVVSVAKKYQNQGVSLSDLINEGNLGLIRAAERFDGTKGVKFISYAVWWIRQAIIQALAANGHTVRVPMNRAGLLYRMGRRASALRQELGRDPTQMELATGLDVSEADIVTSMPISQAYLSLDAPLTDGENANLLDYLPAETADGPDEDSVETKMLESVEGALGRLREREAKVLRMYFGFDGNEPMTLESIGEQFGITRERVRQIKEKALSRMRRSEQAKALAALVDH